ncbi:MAG: hypothetical protein VW258_04060 [Thalassolituus sp.]
MLTVISPITVVAEPEQRTVCDSGDVRHTVQVEYPQGWKVPCQVRFGSPGDSRIVWRAEASEGFCERKAHEIVERRISAGWHCYTEDIFDSPALTDSSLFSDLPPPSR